MTEALIVVDVQNIFVDLAGSDAPRVLAAMNAEIVGAAERGALVVYTRDIAPVDLPDGDRDGRLALHPDLEVRGPVVGKGPGLRSNFSGFLLAPVLGDQVPDGSGSIGPLLACLRAHDVDAVSVIGIATDVCVAATARDAVRLGFDATVRLAGTFPGRPGADDPSSPESEALRAAGVRVA